MNYSTFNLNNFFIKKSSTYPLLKFPLTQKLMEQYDITEDMLENCAITFSMLHSDTGLYRIANVAANLVVNNDRNKFPDEEKYTLTYKFTRNNTSKAGNYWAEFCLDFLDEKYQCYKLKLPINGYINVIINDSITKTDVL
jgi:hypothetical protein